MNNDKQNSSSDQSKPSFVKRVGDPSQTSDDQRKAPSSPVSSDVGKKLSSDTIRPRRIPNDAERAALARSSHSHHGPSNSPATRWQQIPDNYGEPKDTLAQDPQQALRGQRTRQQGMRYQRPQEGNSYPAARQQNSQYQVPASYGVGQAPPPPHNSRSQGNKGKKKRKPVLILLDILIIALIAGGLYFIIKPKYDHYMQDKKTEELRRLMADEQVDESTGEIGIWVDPYAHPVNSGGIDLPPGMSEEDALAALPEPGELVFVQSIARMVIRDIDLNMPVVWGATDAPLQVGLGWYPNSSPLDETGNSVVLGHRMWDFGRHFNRLDEVNVGDQIEVFMDGKRYVYEMTNSIVTKPSDMFQYFEDEDNDKSTLTLVTCTPKRSFENRLLVFADLISVEEDTTQGLPEDYEQP